MTAYWASSERVRFDFEGSLALARKLWALADRLDAQRLARRADAELAGASWRGRYGDEFRARMATEHADFVRVVAGLREEARGWATTWKTAMDEQNKRNRAAQVDAVRAQRSWLERNVGDRVLGDDSDAQVPHVAPAAVPSPPGFLPTCHEVRY